MLIICLHVKTLGWFQIITESQMFIVQSSMTTFKTETKRVVINYLCTFQSYDLMLQILGLIGTLQKLGMKLASFKCVFHA